MFAKPFSLGVGAAIAAAAIAASSAPAHAFTYFTPSGRNLDGDSINDIVTSPGANLSFDLGLDLRPFNTDFLPSTLDVLVSWDTNELSNLSGSVIGGNANITSFTASSATFSVPTSISGRFLFGNLSFLVLDGLKNNGGSDFRTSLALSQIFPDSSTFAIQEVDVQPVPTPALLPGLVGLGVAALRRKGKANAEETV